MKDKYTMEDLFAFMDARRPVNVTCTDGKVHSTLYCASSSTIAIRSIVSVHLPFLLSFDPKLGCLSMRKKRKHTLLNSKKTLCNDNDWGDDGSIKHIALVKYTIKCVIRSIKDSKNPSGN